MILPESGSMAELNEAESTKDAKKTKKEKKMEEKATDKHVADKSGVAVSAAYITAYSEYIRNRDYQDYGRSNGCVLWS